MPLLSRSVLYYLAIALVQGLLLLGVLLYREPVLGAFIVTAVLIGGLNLQLLGSAVRQRGTWLLVAGQTLLMASLSAWLYAQQAHGWLWVRWIPTAVVLAYIGAAFVLSWPTRDGHRLRYPDLYRHAWNNAFIVLLALLVTLAFWLLLWLCGELFSMLGAPIISKTISSQEFIYLSLPIFFSLGIRMGRDNDKVIGLLRNVLLTVCRYLLPLCSLIAVVFTLALAFTGFEPIFKTGYSTAILLCLAGSMLFLVNGVFQDGQQDAGYTRPLKLLVNASLVCLPLLIALAGYSSWLRIDQYGLTPQRFLAMLLVGIAWVHCLAALWAIRPRQPLWLASLRRSNPWIALLSYALLILIFTPLLNPLTYSAANQMARLLDGRTPADKFDLYALRHQLGKPGVAQFERLAQLVKEGQILDTPSRQLLADRLADAEASELTPREYGPKLEWIGPEPADSAQLLTVSVTETQCGGAGCVAWQVDLDDDGVNEVLLVPKHRYSSSAFVYVHEQGVWREQSRLDGLTNGQPLIDQIRQGKVKLVKPRYKTVEIDGVELGVKPYKQPGR